MKAENTGDKIIITATHIETATIVDVLRNYMRKNPNAWDRDLVREILITLDSPTIKD